MLYRKIDAMHKRYGVVENHKCKECCNLVTHTYDKKYFKCTAYGTSSSEATDWAKKWQACGLFNKPVEPNNLRANNLKTNETEPMEKQISLF